MPILGMWMWPESIRQRGAEQVTERCVRAGVTGVFFLAKGLAGTTSFHGSYAPYACERDLLGELLSAAHLHDIRVHAWLTSTGDAHYKHLHPESGRGHYLRGGTGN